MSVFDFFASRHVRWLEAEIADLKRRHETHVAELKSAHAEERDRAITEAARLRGEVDRLRLFLTPALYSIGQSGEVEEPSKGNGEVATLGTPWQRILAREVAKQEADWNRRHTKPADEKPKEASNGSQREGRDATSLSEPGESPRSTDGK
jgi:hypothetical protein